MIASPIRTVVLLMAVAGALFFTAGFLDQVYPGGAGWLGPGVLSHVFGAANVVVAVAIWRGSEQGLMLRIALAAVFFVERIGSAFLFGPKSAPSVGVHLLTAAVELAIFVLSFRVWRLGRSADTTALEALAFAPAAGLTRVGLPGGAAAAAQAALGLGERLAASIGIASLGLAAALVADGIAAGFVPGGRAWGLSGPAAGWLAYLFALLVLIVATRAVHASSLGLVLLIAVSAVVAIERLVSPAVLGAPQVMGLVLHGVGAVFALALAVASAAGLRVVGVAPR